MPKRYRRTPARRAPNPCQPRFKGAPRQRHLVFEQVEERTVLSGVVTIGDSWAWLVAAGAPSVYGPAAPSGYSNALGTVLNQQLGLNIPVYQESFGGGTAAQMVTQLYTPGGIIDRINAHPDASIVWLSSGGNDMLLGLAGGGFYVNNPNNPAVYAAIQQNVQTIVNAILADRPDLQVVIMGYDYLNVFDLPSGGSSDTLRANLGIVKSGNSLLDAVQNQALNQGFKDAEAGKTAIADASRRVAHVDNFGLNNTVHGYSGYFGNFPAAPAGYIPPPELYPVLPTPARYMDGYNSITNTASDPIHLNEQGYETLVANAFLKYLNTALQSASLGVSTTGLPFGNVRVGTSALLGVTGSNVGPAYTEVKNLFFPAATGDFHGGNQSFNPLFQDPNLGSDTATVSYVYTPSSRGADNATLTVTSDSGSANLSLSGQGVGPAFSAPTNLDFGTVASGSTPSVPLSVSNATPDGNLGNLTNLTLNSVSITGPDGGRFSLLGFTPGTVLSAAALDNLPLQFDGTGAAAGTYHAVLTFNTDQGAAFGAAGQQFNISITATVLAPPVAHASGPYASVEGGSVTLSGSASTGDITTYAWDLSGTGTGSFNTLGQTVSYPTPNFGTYTIRLQVSGPGGTSVDTTTVSVANVPPAAAVAGPAVGLRGQSQTFTLTANDPSPTDQAAGFTFAINWGDGSPVQTVAGLSGTTVTHIFNTATLANTISVTATDQDGGLSAPVTSTIEIDAAQLVADQQNPALTDLVWSGTGGNDHVQFQQIDASTVQISESLLNGHAASNVQTYSGVTGRVIGYGNAGSDTLDASGLTATPATLDGGAGNNTLYGGQAGDTLIGGSNGGEGKQGNNVIIAGNGNNTIYGNDVSGAEGATGGNNLIIGGSGNDTIYGAFATVHKKNGQPSNGGEGGQNIIVGGGGSDAIYASQQADGAEGGHGSILIAGATNLNQAALSAVMSEWTSSDALSDKIDKITGATTGGANGSNYLQPGTTVFNDGAVGQLYGDTKGAADWFWYTFGQDNANRTKAGETLTDLS